MFTNVTHQVKIRIKSQSGMNVEKGVLFKTFAAFYQKYSEQNYPIYGTSELTFWKIIIEFWNTFLKY